MKHFTQNLRWLFMSLLLVVGVGSAWGDTVELTQSNLGLTGSYTTNTQKTIGDITYTYTDLLKSGNNIQARASSGVIYNSTAYPGDITNVSITHYGTARSTTISGSADGSNWTQVSTGSGSITADFSGKGYKYFKITRGSNAAYWTKITITYSAGSTNTPNVTIGKTALEVGETTTVSTNGPTVTLQTSDASVASVSGTTVTAEGAGSATITATWSAGTVGGTNYSAGSKTFDVTVTAPFTPTDGTFDFTGTYAYGSGLTPSSANTYIEESKTWTSGNVTLVTDGKYRWWAASGGNSLRVYAPSSGSTTLTLSVPSGKVIKSISITGSNLGGITSDVGTYDNGTWTGSSQTVVFTRSSANTYFSTITVTYEDGSSTPEPVDPTFAWSSATATATVGQAFTAPTLSNNSDGTVTYSSSDTSVATIDASGNVTILAAGETTITASVTATSNYNSATASYTLTVSEPTPANQLVTVDSEGNVTFLFNDTGWGIPEGSTNKTVGPATYTNSGYSITIAGSTGNGFYYGSNYLLMGKSGAYLTLPAFDFDVERIEVVGTSTASGSVIQNIYVGDEAVSTATTGALNVTNSYVINDAYQTQGYVYTLKVTSAHNTQITSIKVYKKSTLPSLSFSSATATVNVGGTYTQTVHAYNIGENTVNYTTNNAEIATVDANGEVTGVSAGTVTITASVTVDGTEYTATYELTVNKNVAELSFATPAVSVAVTETYAGQTVTKPSDILDSEITYSSNNPSVASVEASTGAITLGGGIGKATITATFAGNTKYNAATATYMLTVTDPTAVSGDYVKVTSASDLTDGEYLIVYEEGSIAFNGGLTTLDAGHNVISVTISDDKIESTPEVDAAVFTIEAVEDGYSIQSASGYYIGRSTNSNGLNTSSSYSDGYLNTISFNNNNVIITGTGNRTLQFNNAAGDNNYRFRYYGSGQQAIQLYKKSSASTTVATPTITPETGTYETRPVEVTINCATAGAVIHYTTNGSEPTKSSPVYNGSFNINKNTTVKAIAVLTQDGNDYVSRVASSVITMKVNAPVFSPVDGSSFTEEYNVTISADAGLTIYYITQDSKIFNTEAGGSTATASEGNGTLVSNALVYSSPLTFSQSMMVTAICMDADGNLSEPVTVKYTYTGAVVPPYYSSFSASEGDFTDSQETDGNTISGNGAPEWRMNSNSGTEAIARWGEERYYMFVRGTSGNTVQSRTRWYGSAYLTSPIIDLTGKGNASFSFIHAAHHFYADPNESASINDATLETTLSDAKIPQACKVQVGICDTSGNVSTWTDIESSSITWPEQLFDPSKTGVSADRKSTTNTSSRSGLFPRTNSGDISLSSFVDQKIRIRFAYTSTPSNYGTWNIDQITVNAVDVEEMTMNSKGWTTYVFDHDIDAYTTTQNYLNGGEELKIFKVTEFDHETCVLQQLGKFEEYTTTNDSERYIPAKTPVVIQGPASATINFVEYPSPSMLPTVKNNLLIASLNPNQAVAPVGSGIRYFALQWNNTTNQPWFNKVSEGRSIGDHKAYLNGTDQIDQISQTTNPAKGIFVMGEDWEATGIESVETGVNEQITNGQWYTLQGVRIERPTTQGIYIVNGKKILIIQ